MREFHRRTGILNSLDEWARLNGFEPARHHRLLNHALEQVESGKLRRLIVCEPPGSAKSTYISDLFPPWFLARKPNRCILATSYSYELIESFGRRARNRIEQHSNILGVSLARDSKAAGEWETSNGGRYFCAGTTSGIAGHRADLAFIDDPIGTEEEARSDTFRAKLWAWFWNDFMPRLKPDGAVVIIANRRHCEDLVGMLIGKYPADWKTIKLPLVVETDEQLKNDPLGRQKGEILWPEWFNEALVADARKNENFIGLYQQEPVPDSGNLIKREWLNACEYTPSELPSNLRKYVGSDHALTTKEENDASCLIPVGVDADDTIWVLPDVFWDRVDTGVLVDRMLDIGERHRPVEWWAEDEHIRKAIGPFLRKRMEERRVYFVLTPLPSSKDLRARSSTIRGRIEMAKVRFPSWTSWWPIAKAELLQFDKGKHDDFLAALSEIGRGLDSITRPSHEPVPGPEFGDEPWRPTIKWIRESSAAMERKDEPRYGGR